MPTVHLRDAVLADVPALRDIYRRSSLSNERDRVNLLAHPEVLELADVAVREGRMRVAVSGGQVVGFATTIANGVFIELEDLFVDPDFFKRGAGRVLVQDVIETARKQNAARVEVTANGHALGFYEKLGFVGVGQVSTRFGSALRMHRGLEA